MNKRRVLLIGLWASVIVPPFLTVVIYHLAK